MLTEGVHELTPDMVGLDAYLQSFVMLHASGILEDNTMATFMPPLSFDKMARDWQRMLDQVENGSRVILISVSSVSSRISGENIGSPFGDRSWPTLPPNLLQETPLDGLQSILEVSGVVSLAKPESEVGPFRGQVQRLFVSPYHRRKHIATDLMLELEKRALSIGRWSLMLDTTIGTSAVHLYPKLGYEELGVVRNYGFNPRDGSYVDEVFFWKDLRKASLQAE